MTVMPEKEWTLMFYFASDNGLAPEVVSQLKAIKQAGFHDDVNVIAQFDPNTANTDTHIFDVNRINKLKAGECKIGFIGMTARDPYVVNLMTDKVWRKDEEEGGIRNEIIESLRTCEIEFDPPVPPSRPQTRRGVKGSGESEPKKSLVEFLTFCRDYYPAKHYVLFIIGHGLVVGNDTFLQDENASEHSLTLTELGEILNDFRKEVDRKNGVFELVSFHSCSMSSLEVAYQLQYEVDDGRFVGTANYMLAAQGPSFVGSWPYRQILIRIFNHVARREAGERQVKELFRDIFHYCLYNSYDFIVAGYNFDVSLCDLNKVSDTQASISELSQHLISGLDYPQIQERLLLAHLDAQSYWLENYIDLRDFCRSVKRRFASAAPGSLPAEVSVNITTACDNVIKVFRKGDKQFDDLLVVRSEFAGASSQYSQGLSIFFPWSRPIKPEFWPQEYQNYRFTTVYKDNGTPWSKFLSAYFERTKRDARQVEDEKETPQTEAGATGAPARKKRRQQTIQEKLLEQFASRVFDRSGQLSKGSPRDSQGDDDCECPTIKNYPSFIRAPQEGTEGLEHTGTHAGTLVSPTFIDDADSFRQDSDATFLLDGLG